MSFCIFFWPKTLSRKKILISITSFIIYYFSYIFIKNSLKQIDKVQNSNDNPKTEIIVNQLHLLRLYFEIRDNLYPSDLYLHQSLN